MAGFRVLLSVATLLAGSAALAVPAAARAAAPALVPAAVSCLELMTVTFSPAAEAAALRYWTPPRMIAASESRGPSDPAHAAGMGVAPTITTQCVARLAATGAAGVPPGTGGNDSFGGYPSVGKLFISNLSGPTGPCTGSVFNGSDKKNNASLVLTAAHCIYGVRKGRAYLNTSAIFAPKWADGKSPYGRWTAGKVVMVSGWVRCPTATTCYTHPEWDYAILVMGTLHGHEIGQVTGENGWRLTARGTVRNVRLVGYPAKASKPLTNTATAVTVTKGGQPYWRASSPGFSDGTSGGPWLTSFSARDDLGILLTDVGGYDEGGPTPSPSYGPLWDASFASAVKQAVKEEG